MRILVRERPDEGAYRRSGPLAQGAQGARGIACDLRILVLQRTSQRRLNRFRIGREVDQRIGGDGGWRPDRAGAGRPAAESPPDRCGGRSRNVARSRSSSPRSRNRRSSGNERAAASDEGGFGDGPHLGVLGRHAIGPVKDRRVIRGKIRDPCFDAAEAANPWFARVLLSAEDKAACR